MVNLWTPEWFRTNWLKWGCDSHWERSSPGAACCSGGTRHDPLRWAIWFRWKGRPTNAQSASSSHKTNLSASCARTEIFIHSTLKKAFVIGLTRLDFSNNTLTDTLPYCRDANHSWKLENFFAVPDKGICESFNACVAAWYADEYHYQLHDVLQYVGYG